VLRFWCNLGPKNIYVVFQISRHFTLAVPYVFNSLESWCKYFITWNETLGLAVCAAASSWIPTQESGLQNKTTSGRDRTHLSTLTGVKLNHCTSCVLFVSNVGCIYCCADAAESSMAPSRLGASIYEGDKSGIAWGERQHSHSAHVARVQDTSITRMFTELYSCSPICGIASNRMWSQV
jgi:hypothetical protein